MKWSTLQVNLERSNSILYFDWVKVIDVLVFVTRPQKDDLCDEAVQHFCPHGLLSIQILFGVISYITSWIGCTTSS